MFEHRDQSPVEELIDRIRWRITMGYGPDRIAAEFGQYHDQETIYLAYVAAQILIKRGEEDNKNGEIKY